MKTKPHGVPTENVRLVFLFLYKAPCCVSERRVSSTQQALPSFHLGEEPRGHVASLPLENIRIASRIPMVILPFHEHSEAVTPFMGNSCCQQVVKISTRDFQEFVLIHRGNCQILESEGTYWHIIELNESS